MKVKEVGKEEGEYLRGAISKGTTEAVESSEITLY
jgi:hypothetical protein